MNIHILCCETVTPDLVMCANNHPGQLCFEGAVAQSRETSRLVLGPSLRTCHMYLPHAFDSWCILGCVH